MNIKGKLHLFHSPLIGSTSHTTRHCVRIETIDECSSNPCLNGGTCEDEVNFYTCTCPLGFTGDRCETNIHSCYGEICSSNGILQIDLHSFSCICAGGYTGQRCELEFDECSSSPCLNGGTCEDGFNSYTCECANEATGDSCEIGINNHDTIWVNDCQQIICKNDGNSDSHF